MANTTFDRYSRRAHHAGSWYSSNRTELDQALDGYLNDVSTTSTSSSLRGIICPHAGFSYSGPTAAYSYQALAKELSKPDSPIRRILVLHPSHHVYLSGCAVSGASTIETPFANLNVDDELRAEILGLFHKSKLDYSFMTQSVDEHEHSGEMQYPFIAKCIPSNKNISVLPIMCGNLSTENERAFGQCLAPIVSRSDVLCVVSSDFCHWGNRFSYQPTGGGTTTKKIYEYIRDMDRRGMDNIQMQDPGAFATYLKETKNTICGRHPIAVWLNAIHHNNESQHEVLDIAWVKYAQSSEVNSMRESSVSYASAVTTKV